ncbi:MAG: phosphatase PAP2 family protein [Francisellaceae bacterium]|jgi:membrane-associated phospholipid phosphatase|nr:phosphatase PAP2 family protein [Francisellaceae bacterium]MBT6207878.1 phosphatase PAP2 family protein [Francisellaceae bacterium]MBT6538515.1 phosphatase PAP2 family protein [Francisellaceae bacterium]
MSDSNLLDILARGHLAFTTEIILIPTVAVGYHFISRRIYINATVILLFMMVFNTYLKSIWQIPLPTHIGTGWSFPSGHMASAIVFWGYLALENKHRIFVGITAVGLIGVALSLIHFGYHTLTDILGAVFFSSITLAMFFHINKKVQDGNLFKVSGILMLLSGFLIYLLPNPVPFTWFAFIGLIIITLTGLTTRNINNSVYR